MGKDKKKQSTAGKYSNGRKKKGAIAAIWIGAVVLVLAIAAVGFFILTQMGILSPRLNTTIYGVDVSGMSRWNAAKAVAPAAEEFFRQPMVMVLGEDKITFPQELTQAELDVDKYLTALYNAAPEDRDQIDPVNYLNLDQGAIRAELEKVVQEYTTELVQGSYAVAGTAATLTNPQEFPGDQALVVTIGTPGLNLELTMLQEAVLEAYSTGQMEFTYEIQTVEPAAPDVDAAFEQYCSQPVSSEFDEQFIASDHVYGYTFDLEKVKADIAQAPYGTVLEYPFTVIEPETTKESLEALLFRDTLATHTATNASIPGGRDVNLRLSCEKINGIILYPGDEFDYNAALGERTADAGWQKAAGYVGLETVYEYGGGICQASSVLYYCCLLSDMEIVTRSSHTFISAYMDPGMDATVSWGWPDFKFKNNSEYPVKILATADGGTVTVSLVGTETKDYYVKMEYSILSTTSWKTVYEEMPEDNEKGYKDGQTIITPYTGYKVQTYKLKYDRETNELISREKEAYSDYSSRDKVVCKIVKEEEPTTPAETTLPPETTMEPETTASPEISEPMETTEPDLSGSGGNVGEG